MSKLRNDAPREAEVRLREGELRKPDDRSDQPGQGADLTPPNDGHLRDRRRDPEREPRTEAGRPAR